MPIYNISLCPCPSCAPHCQQPRLRQVSECSPRMRKVSMCDGDRSTGLSDLGPLMRDGTGPLIDVEWDKPEKNHERRHLCAEEPITMALPTACSSIESPSFIDSHSFIYGRCQIQPKSKPLLVNAHFQSKRNKKQRMPLHRILAQSTRF